MFRFQLLVLVVLTPLPATPAPPDATAAGDGWGSVTLSNVPIKLKVVEKD